MKKHLILFVLAALLLSGCGSAAPEQTEAPGPSETIKVIPMTPDSETTEVFPTEGPSAEEETPLPDFTEAPVSLAPEAYRVVYNYLQDGDHEFYTFQGIDPDNQVVWNRESAHLPCAQLPMVYPLGTMDGKFFYCEDGSILALDVITGELLWENYDFQGSIGSEAAVLLDPSGFICLCGYFGPDLFVLDTEGNTVRKIPSFESGYFWASRLWQEGDLLYVHLDGGAPEGKDFSLPMDWIPQPLG